MIFDMILEYYLVFVLRGTTPPPTYGACAGCMGQFKYTTCSSNGTLISILHRILRCHVLQMKRQLSPAPNNQRIGQSGSKIVLYVNLNNSLQYIFISLLLLFTLIYITCPYNCI